jgi:hypothetical protein
MGMLGKLLIPILVHKVLKASRVSRELKVFRVLRVHKV